jgi:hypothetical protein
MEERDYLLRQMNSLGRALGKLLSDLLKNNNKSNPDIIEITNNTLINEINLNLISLINLSDDSFIDLLLNKNELDILSIENLVEILIKNSEFNINNYFTKSEILKLYNKCLLIYRHIDEISKVYSIERQNKIAFLNNKIFQIVNILKP